MTTDLDPRTRIVLSWLRGDAHENAERVLLLALDEVDATSQRRSWWPAWRTFHMSKLAMTATAAALLAVAVVGYNFLPSLGILGPGAAPSPTPTLLARGNFVTGEHAVELEAIAQGSSVMGRMSVSGTSGEAWSFTVEFECTRTTEEGLILIGGMTTSTTGGGSELSPVGRRAAIVLKPGSPVQAKVWSERGGQPVAFAPSCDASLDAQLADERRGLGFALEVDPIVGAVELGP